LTAGLIASVMLRRQPAALRHWLLASTLALACAQPLITRVIPQWQVVAVSRLWSPPAAGPTDLVETAVTFDIPTGLAVETSSKFNWVPYVFAAWLIGALSSFALLLAGALWLMRLESRGTDADDAWQSIGDEVRAQLGISKPIRIAVTDHPALLVTWGVLSPVILLPAGANAWPAERMRIVVAHEMAHLARHDWPVQLLAEMVRATQWFNPLFWSACARLRCESEQACDDIVIESGIGGASYASHLLALARSFSVHGRTWLPAPSIARPSTLERRVRAMLNPHTDRRPVTRLRRTAMALLLLAIAVPIAAASQAFSASSGRVTDPSGLPLPDALVRLASTSTDAVYESRTDASGFFQLPDVPPGDYLLSARVPGFSSQRQRVHIAGPVTFNMQMQVGTLQETITVKPGPAPESSARASSSAPSTAVAPTCGTTEVGGNIKPPQKVKDVRPRYRQAWADANQEGTVLLQALIGTDGLVKSVEVVSPVQADMEEEAIAAVTQWEFTPTYLNCQAIEVRMFVTVAFKLDR